MTDNGKFIPEITRRIDLGHILQAGVFLVAFLGVLGACIGAYVSTQGRLTEQSTLIANQQQQINDLVKRIQQVQEDQRQSDRDITVAQTKVYDQLIDLRVTVAKMQDGFK